LNTDTDEEGNPVEASRDKNNFYADKDLRNDSNLDKIFRNMDLISMRRSFQLDEEKIQGEDKAI
jgi:hypothetical protein